MAGASRVFRTPFAALVWPGVGPSFDLLRTWPELLVVALGALLFGWSAFPAGAPAAAGLAPAAGLNPIYGLGALLLGPLAGARLAVRLSLMAAGIGMWWLGTVLGAGRIGRTWAGLAYAFAGAAASAFGRGDFPFALGVAWLPWVAAFGVAAVQARRRLFAVLSAAALALVLIGGDPGLALATLLAAALAAIVAGVMRLAPAGRPSPASVIGAAVIGAVIGAAVIGAVILALGFGLAAPAWLPAAAGGLPARQAASGAISTGGLGGVVAALFAKPRALHPLVAYVGIAPLLCLACLPLPVRRGRGRLLVGTGLLCVFAVALAAAGWPRPVPVQAGLLAWGAVALLSLAGAGLDAAWTWATAHLELRRVRVPEAVEWATARLTVAGVALLLVLSLVDLYRSNRGLLMGMMPGSPAPAPGAQFSVVDRVRDLATGQPIFFWTGAAVSAFSLLAVLALVVGDHRARRRSIEAEAVYRDGVLRPEAPLELPEGTAVHVTVTPAGEVATEGEAPEGRTALEPKPSAPDAGPPDVVAPPWPAPVRAPAAVQAPERRPRGGQAAALLRDAGPAANRVAWVLFGLGLVVYAVTRLWGIERFPIYFFTDEATFALLAEQLLSRGLRDSQGAFLPLYFEVAGNRWTPVLAVYVHLPAIALFGKSVLVTRATSALVTLLAPIAVGLTLRSVFRIRYWWAAALLVSVVPTWFLHSRTAFEWLMMASFYACFLLCYLLYRTRSPRFLFLAILFGAATFYNHASGQVVMATAAVLLAVSDLRYHLKNWRIVLLGLLLIGVLAVPLVRMQLQRPEALLTHLRAIDSYWFRDLPFVDKLRQFVTTYAYGLSPAYWFDPNSRDLVRHLMKGYGHLGWLMLPLVLVGTALCLRRVRSAPHRALLLAALAAPAGAATAEVAITRMMAFIPPVCIIAGLGLDLLLEWIRKVLQRPAAEPGAGAARSRHVGAAVALVVFAGLSGASLWMLRDALANGPTWYRDYGLYGMQYGARQLFAEAIPQYLAEHPGSTVAVSSSWANGTDTFVRFFLPAEQQFTRVQMHDVRYYMFERRELSLDMTLVMTPEEYEQAAASGKFKTIEVDRTVPYPDGRTGFYFARLAYADDLEQILAREREERSRPVVEQVVLDGQTVEVRHSQLDMGEMPNVFDGDPFTLVRGLEANPLVFDFTFPEPRQMGGLEAVFGAMDFSLKASLYADSAAEPVVYEQEFRGLPPPPKARMVFDRGPAAVSRVRLEVLHLNAGPEVHIEARELKFQ